MQQAKGWFTKMTSSSSPPHRPPSASDQYPNTRRRMEHPEYDEVLSLEQMLEKIEILERENRRLQYELTKERKEAEKLHSQRDVQLESMKEYLDTYDKSGVSDIVGQLDLLNDLIDQFASDVAENLQPPSGPKTSGSALAASTAPLAELLGTRLIQVIDECDQNDIGGAVVLFQYATQMVVVQKLLAVCNIGFAHRFGGVSNATARVFEDLKQRVQAQEIQPVYGRWRSITQKYLRSSVDSEVHEQLVMEFVFDASKSIADIRDIICGTPHNTEGHSVLFDTLSPSLRNIYEKALQFSVMIKEEVVTADYIVYIAIPAERFSPRRMAFPYEKGDAPTGDTVVCTVKFGLLSRGKRGRERIEVSEKVVKPAHVVTESVLDELLGTQEPQRRSK